MRDESSHQPVAIPPRSSCAKRTCDSSATTCRAAYLARGAPEFVVLRYDGIVARRESGREVAILGRQIGLGFAVMLGTVLLLALSPAVSGQPVEDVVDYDPAGAPYAAGELIVTYEEDAPVTAVEALPEEAGGEIEGHLPAIDARQIGRASCRERV